MNPRHQSTNSRMVKPATTMVFAPKTSRAVCDAATKEKIKQIFNEVLKQESCTPATWRRINKGNEEDVGNYRPICTLAALYKLFSTILKKQTLFHT